MCNIHYYIFFKVSVKHFFQHLKTALYLFTPFTQPITSVLARYMRHYQISTSTQQTSHTGTTIISPNKEDKGHQQSEWMDILHMTLK